MTRLPASRGADGQRGRPCTTVQQRLLQHLHHVLIPLVQITGSTPTEPEIPTGWDAQPWNQRLNTRSVSLPTGSADRRRTTGAGEIRAKRLSTTS